MKRILIVDDAKVMRATMTSMITNFGYQVVGNAANGFEAVEEYKIHKPDLVTMDITMPDVNGVADGINAVKLIKEYDKNAIIIMVTSHGEEDKVINAIRNGASNYVLKPIDKNKLKQVLSDLLD